MPTLSQIYPTYDTAVRVVNDLEAAGVPATDITLVSGEKGAGARTGAAGKSEAETRAHAEAIRRGGTLVSVRADDVRASEIEAILRIPLARQDAGQAVRESAAAPAAPAAVVPAAEQGAAEAAAELGQPPGAAPAGAFGERVIEVRATGEEPVFSKEARVVEEIVIRKGEGDRTEVVRDTVRETKVDIEDTTPRR